MKPIIDDLKRVLFEIGYKQITTVEKGFTAKNWFNEDREFRIDILGSGDVKFYNIVAVGVTQHDYDVIKPIQVKYIEKTDDDEYKYLITVLDLLVNKTDDQIKELELNI